MKPVLAKGNKIPDLFSMCLGASPFTTFSRLVHKSWIPQQNCGLYTLHAYDNHSMTVHHHVEKVGQGHRDHETANHTVTPAIQETSLRLTFQIHI